MQGLQCGPDPEGSDPPGAFLRGLLYRRLFPVGVFLYRVFYIGAAYKGLLTEVVYRAVYRAFS
jgi:hypothetical protein